MQALFLRILSLALCTNGAENLQTSLQAFVLQKPCQLYWSGCTGDQLAMPFSQATNVSLPETPPNQQLTILHSPHSCCCAAQLCCRLMLRRCLNWQQAGLGLSFLRGRKDTGLCVSIICLKRDETLSNYFSSNPDASNHSDHVYGPVHTWQNFCFLLQSLMRFLGLWVIPCSPPTSSSTNRLFSKSIILGTQPTYLNEASTYYK